MIFKHQELQTELTTTSELLWKTSATPAGCDNILISWPSTPVQQALIAESYFWARTITFEKQNRWAKGKLLTCIPLRRWTFFLMFEQRSSDVNMWLHTPLLKRFCLHHDLTVTVCVLYLSKVKECEAFFLTFLSSRTCLLVAHIQEEIAVYPQCIFGEWIMLFFYLKVFNFNDKTWLKRLLFDIISIMLGNSWS